MAKKDNIKILLVDDEEDFVNALSQRIKLRKLDSEIAYNGEQALQFIEDHEPDVIILELKMQGIDGFEILKSVKRNYPKTEVIILTSHTTERDKIKAQKLGVFGYLPKPIDVDALIDSIKFAYKKKNKTTTVAEARDGDAHRNISEMWRDKFLN